MLSPSIIALTWWNNHQAKLGGGRATLERRLRSAGWLMAALAALAACGDELNEEELDCEEAVAYLEDCCPGFSGARLSCVYESGAGCSATTPDLGIRESRCIRARSCSGLVRSGVCQRAQAMVSNPSGVQPSESGELCP